MGTFVLHSSLFAFPKLECENVGTYVHFVFIYKCPSKIFIYWPIFKIESSTNS